MKTYRVTTKELRQIDAQITANKKIGAIKVLRIATQCGLREAKNAIEDRMGQTSHGIKIISEQLFKIKSFVVENSTDGNIIEVDMEYLRMRFPMQPQEVGVHEYEELLMLIKFIEKWQSEE